MDGDQHSSTPRSIGDVVTGKSGIDLLARFRKPGIDAPLPPECPTTVPIAALDAATQAVAITDAPPGRRIVFANRALCRLTGYRQEEIIGQTFRLFSCPQTEFDATEKLRLAVQDGRSATADITCARKDGSLYRIRTHVSPIKNAQGRITHWISFQKDITAEDHAYARLEAITERLEATLAATGDGAWDWDIVAGSMHWSDRLLEMLGLEGTEREALTIDTFLSHTHPADRGRLLRAMRAHLTERRPLNISLRMLHRGGQILEVTCKGRASFDDADTAQRMVGTISDVSALAKANRRLLRTESMAQIGNWDFDAGSDEMLWSAETGRILGSLTEMSKSRLDRFVDCFHPDDRIMVDASINAGQSFVIDARVVQPSGALRHVQLSGDGVHGHDGQVIGMFGVIQDTTRRVEQEASMQRARKMEAFGQLAGGVAHDFNNLMAVIMGNLELLKETPADDPLRTDLIEEALSAVVRGRDLTGSLLNFTHKAVLRPRLIDVAQCLSEVRRIGHTSLPAGVELRVNHDPAVGQVSVDPAGLQSCLIGLILNARDATSDLSAIRLQTRMITAISGDPRLISSDGGRALPPGTYVEISVIDKGRGIAPDNLSRIFEPFFTTKGVGKGSGLGLSRVSGFAQQSGGAVRVESVEGRGTTVAILLPRA